MWTSAFLSLLVTDESLLLMTKNDLLVSLALWISACYDNHAAFGLVWMIHFTDGQGQWKFLDCISNNNNCWLHYWEEISSFACIYLPGLFPTLPAGFLDKWKQCRNDLTSIHLYLKSHGQILYIYCRCKIISRFQPFLLLYWRMWEGRKSIFFCPWNCILRSSLASYLHISSNKYFINNHSFAWTKVHFCCVQSPWCCSNSV